MPDLLSELSDEDRADFTSRLGVYGVDATALLSRELVTSPSTITTLSTRRDTASQFKPVLLRTSDFDRVNQWIGMPDAVFDTAEPVVEAPPSRRDGLLSRVSVQPVPAARLSGRPDLRATAARLRPGARVAAPAGVPVAEAGVLSSEDLSEVRMAARAYLRGDSRKFSAYKSIIESVFPVVEIPLWAFLDITVKSGSVLEFGPGPHALVAYRITVEEGGVIRSYGDLTVSATILRRTSPLTLQPFDPSMLASRIFGGLVFEGGVQ